MNWLLIVVAAVIAGFGIRGYQKGIIKMTISIISMVLGIVIAFTLSPMISDSLCNSDIVRNYVSQWVNEGLGIEEKCLEMTDNMVNSIKGTDKKESEKISVTQKKEVIENLKLPEKIKNSISENIAEEVGTKGKITAVNFAGVISEYIARLIIKTVTYIVIFIIFKVLLHFVMIVFNLVDKLPIIGEMNELAGGAVGVVSGLFIVWLGFFALLLFSTTSFGISCYECINDSEILTFLYNNNLLVHWVLKSVI